jgi:integrase
MASISRDPNGTRRIQFFAGDGSRKTIRLPGATAKQAEAFRVKLEALLSVTSYGTHDEDVTRWLASLSDDMKDKLSALGLTRPRNRTSPALGGFLEEYFAQLEVKPLTLIAYGNTRRCLLEFFGKDKLLRDIEPADAGRYRAWLRTANLNAEYLSDATVNKRSAMARMIFGKAVRWKLISDNPFEDLKAGDTTNDARSFNVTREMADKVMEACPNAEWRLLFALSRYGGLRCPSEHVLLKWSDVDWANNRMTVHSPKTERYKGKDQRVIPLFPELRGPLMEVFEAAEPGTEWVITHCRQPSANLRTHMLRIIRRAGLKPWPRVFHNLRATRQTELAEEYPMQVVCSWIGNTEKIAMDHYLQTWDSHFARAICAQQSATQSTADKGGLTRTPQNGDVQKTAENPVKSSLVLTGPALTVAATGLEPVTRGL